MGDYMYSLAVIRRRPTGGRKVLPALAEKVDRDGGPSYADVAKFA